MLFLVPGVVFSQDDYGSIAYNDERQLYAYSLNSPTQPKADVRALLKCGKRCRVITRFKNACASVATGIGAYGWAVSPNRNMARNHSRAQCQKFKGRSCRVIQTICTRQIVFRKRSKR